LVEGAPSKTILLVDDDEVTRYLVGGALTKAGYRILEAHGGREALRIIQKDAPHAIVLDLAMPDMTGFEVLREIRGMGLSKEIPVIVHSSRQLSHQERTSLITSDALIYSKDEFNRQGGPEELVNLIHSAGI